MKNVNVKIAKNIASGDRNGITKLFHEIYDEYFKLVYFVSFSYLKNEYDAEDISQDVFLKFFEKCKDFGWISRIANVKSYLCASAKNASIKKIEERQKMEMIEDTDSIPSRQSEKLVESDLRAILNQLDSEEIDLIVNHVYLEMSFKEIAEQQNVSINTTKSKYRRTIHKLRRYLK